IAEGRTIQFDYLRTSDKQFTVRRINPYLLVFYGDHWNLIGHSHKRNGLRNFILDQITNIKPTKKTFTPQNIDIKALIYRPEEMSHKITIEVKEAVFEQFLANLPAQVISKERAKDNYTIKFKFNNLNYINEWLLQFADNIKIIAPKALIEKRVKKLTKMIEKQK